MKRFAVLPFLLFALACADTPTEVSPTPDDLALAADFQGNSPAESGIVIRGGAYGSISWMDEESGLRAVFGISMADYCAGNLNFTDYVTGMIVFTPSGDVHRNQQAPIYTEVYGFTDWDCELFTTIGPLATGYSMLKNVDNDLDGVSPDDPSANAWKWTANGVLAYTADDSKAIFKLYRKFVYSNQFGLKSKTFISLR
jgi:hypothetical protein